MRKTNVVGALVVAAFAVALVAFWMPRGEPVVPAASGANTKDGLDQGPEAHAPAVDAQRSAADTGPSPSAAPRSRDVRVRVVHADTGAPVAGASVQPAPFWQPRGRPRPGGQPEDSQTVEPVATGLPAVLPTDDKGETVFACAWSGVVLRATTDAGLFGSQAFREIGSEPLVVPVRVDRTLLVKVEGRHTTSGIGNIPVCLGHVEVSRTEQKLRRRHVQRTDAASGIAQFRHVQDWLQSAAGAGRAWIDIPLRQEASVAMGEQNADGRPVVLKLPETGTVLVRVVGDRSGQPIEGINVKLGAYADARATMPVTASGLWGKGTTDQNGEVRLGPIGLGFWVSAWPSGSPDTLFGKERSEGPRFDGEQCLFVIKMAEDRPRLQGTVVTADGLPWASTLLTFQVRSGARLLTPITGLLCTTDERGYFDCQLAERWTEAAQITIATASSVERPEPKTLLRLGPPSASGRVDCGEVVLDVGPLLAAGRVVAALDDAVVDVLVEVQASDANGVALAPGWTTGGGVIEGGRFAVHAAHGCDVAGGKVRIVLRGRGLVETAVEGAVGRADWVVKVSRSGGVQGRLLPEGDVVPSECKVLLSRDSVGYGVADVDENGGFAFHDVKAGTYRVSVTLRTEDQAGKDRTRVSIQDVVVANDSICVDPRLVDIGVGSSLPLTEIHVTSERGGLVRGAVVRIDENLPAMLLPTTDASGCVRLRARPATKFLVTCDGFEPWIGSTMPGRVPVVLAPSK